MNISQNIFDCITRKGADWNEAQNKKDAENK